MTTETETAQARVWAYDFKGTRRYMISGGGKGTYGNGRGAAETTDDINEAARFTDESEASEAYRSFNGWIIARLYLVPVPAEAERLAPVHVVHDVHAVHDPVPPPRVTVTAIARAHAEIIAARHTALADFLDLHSRAIDRYAHHTSLSISAGHVPSVALFRFEVNALEAQRLCQALASYRRPDGNAIEWKREFRDEYFHYIGDFGLFQVRLHAAEPAPKPAAV